MTTKAQHTPTPWAWCNDNTCLYGNENKEKSTQDCILHCDGAINAPNEEDARLIASAPELLEECKEFMTAYMIKDDEKRQIALFRATKSANLAIAKAEGK